MYFRITTNGPSERKPGLLATATLVFEDADDLLAGMELQGFEIRQRKDTNLTDGPCTDPTCPRCKHLIEVVMPHRSYQVNRDKRTFSLLRPQAGRVTGMIEAALKLAWEQHRAAQRAQKAGR